MSTSIKHTSLHILHGMSWEPYGAQKQMSPSRKRRKLRWETAGLKILSVNNISNDTLISKALNYGDLKCQWSTFNHFWQTTLKQCLPIMPRQKRPQRSSNRALDQMFHSVYFPKSSRFPRSLMQDLGGEVVQSHYKCNPILLVHSLRFWEQGTHW